MTKRTSLIAAVVVVLVVSAMFRCRGKDSSSTDVSEPEIHSRSTTIDRAKLVTHAVSGRVIRKADGTGIAGAIVAITPVLGQPGLSTMEPPPIIARADRNGRWSTAASAGSYRVAATARGFAPAVTTTVLREGESLELALDTGGAVIRGTISDLGGGPVAGATVLAVRDAATYATFSEPDGSYELAIDGGEVALRVTHDDYATAIVSAPATRDREIVVNVVLEPAGVIHGRVVTREGTPVADAVIEIRDREFGNWWRQWAQSDDAGEFTLRGVKSGVVEIAARARGFASAMPASVPLGLGMQVDEVRVVVDPAFSITGRVVDEARRPIAGAILRAVGDADRISRSTATTTEDGAFEIVGLRPGIHEVVATGALLYKRDTDKIDVTEDVAGVEIVVERGTRLAGRVEPPMRARVEITGPYADVEAGADGRFVFEHRRDEKGRIDVTTEDGRVGHLEILPGARDVVVRVDRTAELTGRVIDERGEPIAGAEVYVEAQRYVPTTTAKDGTFRVRGLEGERARVAAVVEDAMVRTEVSTHSPPITLTLPLPRGTIAATVVDSIGAPLRDARVSAFFEHAGLGPAPQYIELASTSRRSAISSATGELVIDRLAPGRYTLRLEASDGTADVEVANVAVGSSIRLVAKPRGAIAGRVTANGAPVTAYTIDCQGGSSYWRAITDPAGAFLLEYLRAGHYTCHVESARGEATAELDVGGTRSKLDFALKPWATITGRVVDMITGEPLRGVYVLQEEGRDWDKLRRGTAIRSDEHGQFRTEQVRGTLQFLRVMNAETLDRADVTSPIVRVLAGGEQVDLGTLEVPGSVAAPRGRIGCEVDDASTVTAVAGRCEAAGIRVGDVVRSVNGRHVPGWRWDTAFVAGRAYQLELARDTITVVPQPW